MEKGGQLRLVEVGEVVVAVHHVHLPLAVPQAGGGANEVAHQVGAAVKDQQRHPVVGVIARAVHPPLAHGGFGATGGHQLGHLVAVHQVVVDVVAALGGGAEVNGDEGGEELLQIFGGDRHHAVFVLLKNHGRGLPGGEAGGGIVQQSPACRRCCRQNYQQQNPFQALPPQVGGDGGRFPGADALGAVGTEGGICRQVCAAVRAVMFHKEPLFHSKMTCTVLRMLSVALRISSSLPEKRDWARRMV